MNERPPETTELDDATERKIAYIMDTRGFSRADAEELIGAPERQVSIVKKETAETGVRQRHSTDVARPRTRYNLRPPVGEDSQHIPTGDINDEQASINKRGAALFMAALRQNEAPLTSYELALRRVKQEKKGRRF